jgi:hypothetical protein
MSYGFVYLLGNEYMPDLIKVGCTERSPFARAEELSRPTGVPTPFQVLCYAEFQDFQSVERRLHEWLASFRISNSREFFFGCLDDAVSMLWFHPHRLSFTDATANSRNPHDSELVARVCSGDKHLHYFDDLRNPFATQAENDAKEAMRIKVAQEVEAEVDREAAAEAASGSSDEPDGGLRLVAGGAE